MKIYRNVAVGTCRGCKSRKHSHWFLEFDRLEREGYRSEDKRGRRKRKAPWRTEPLAA